MRIHTFLFTLLLSSFFGCDSKKAIDDLASNPAAQKVLGELASEKEVMAQALQELEKTPEVETLEEALDMVDFQQTVEKKLDEEISKDIPLLTEEESEILEEVLSEPIEEDSIETEEVEIEPEIETEVLEESVGSEEQVEDNTVDLTYSNLSDFNFNNQDIYEQPVDISGSDLSQNEELPYYQLSWNEVQYNEETTFPHVDEVLEQQWTVAHESSVELAENLLLKLSNEEKRLEKQEQQLSKKLKNKNLTLRKEEIINKRISQLEKMLERIRIESKNLEDKKARIQNKIQTLQSGSESL